ncbi:zinc-binding dehydrogenase [Acrocarpospora macrocephala]|uniref:Oxidoreductase n=1 Tax=Acrocarpospora macrocephala TaxID=150177 RepID=A0A5M3WYB5_9ACTN|nr:zinc-binding dehydrogenase [Acrocarpospora macrocephala]GES11513.1 oxidoreductase [Acrocarpospora macrocephala]
MKGLRFARHGGPEVLGWDEVPVPEPGTGELLIEVRAFAVNWADLLERAGRYPGAPEPPYVMGHDLTGVVVARGPGAEGPPIGTRVFGVISKGGAAAEFVTAPVTQVYPAPATLSDAQAAGAAGPYLTADAAILTMGRLRKGEDVLIHAAAGAYGSACLQLCRAYGAGRIIATAGSDAKAERIRQWGADVAVNYTTRDFAEVVREVTGGRGVPLLLESVGGEVLDRSLDCLSPGGRLVSVGASSGRGSQRLRLHTLFELGVSVSGFTLGTWLAHNPELVRPSVERVLQQFENGGAAPVVARVFPAAEVAAAHEFLAARRSVGRTVVTVAEAL